MASLSFALVQTDLFWENPTANRAMLEEKIVGIKQAIDVVVLPEMFTTGFSMNPAEHAEPMGFTTMRWMKQMAKITNAAVVGSLAIKEKGLFYNRLVWMQPDGHFETYDKRHLFSIGGENQAYTAGKKTLIVPWRGFNIACFVCYDLRFPVWSRNLQLQYDVLLNVANWPAARTHVWQILLRARAIENAAYCIGTNRIGLDGLGLAHEGHSAIIDFKGYEIATAQNTETIVYKTIEKQPLVDFRAKFPTHIDADDFEVLGL